MMPESAHFLTIDLGASGGRVLLGGWDGQQLTLDELHRFENVPVEVPGGLHWDVLRLWSEIKAGIAEYAQRSSNRLSGIGIDTWGVDYALLDRAGRLVGNPYNYRDQRSRGMLQQVTDRVPRAEIFARTGLQFLEINTLYQLYSMVASNDPQLAQAETLLMMPDLFHYWLTGQQATEYTNATTTQLLGGASRQWDTELAERLAIPAHLFAPLVEPGTLLGQLRPAVVAETGLRHSPPVIVPATHDTASAVAAIPGLDAQSAYISSGTWSLMGVETAAPIMTEQALAFNMTNEGGVAGTIRLLKNINGLWLLQESRRQWQREGRQMSWEALLAAADQAQPLQSIINPDAPDFMVPGDLPGAIRAFCRATGQPVPADVGAIVRCCLESLALKYRQVLGELQTLTQSTLTTIRIVGGGCRNQLLCQYTADACGIAVAAGPSEATALGNLLVQVIAAGFIPDLASGRAALMQTSAIDYYQPRSHADWNAAFTRFCGLPGMV